MYIQFFQEHHLYVLYRTFRYGESSRQRETANYYPHEVASRTRGDSVVVCVCSFVTDSSQGNTN